MLQILIYDSILHRISPAGNVTCELSRVIIKLGELQAVANPDFDIYTKYTGKCDEKPSNVPAILTAVNHILNESLTIGKSPSGKS